MEITARPPLTAAPVAVVTAEIEDRAFGFTAATLISGGFGTALFGFITLIAEVFVKTQPSLTLTKSVGPLSGKVAYAVIGWLVGYAVLAIAFRGRNVAEKTTYVITGILIALGFVLTFPPVWKLFGA